MIPVGSDAGRVTSSPVKSLLRLRVFVYLVSLIPWCLLSCGRSDGLVRKVSVKDDVTSVVTVRANDTSVRSSDVYLSNVLSYLDSGLLEINISDADSVWMPLNRSGCDSIMLTELDVQTKERRGSLADSQPGHRNVAKAVPSVVRHRSRRVSVTSRRRLSAASLDTMISGGRSASKTSRVLSSRLSDSTRYSSLTSDTLESRSKWGVLNSLRSTLLEVTGTATFTIFGFLLVRWMFRRFFL